MYKNTLLATPEALARLKPEDLTASATDAVREILAEAASVNTTRSYASALRYWAAWFQGRYGTPITVPVPEAAVVQFIVDHVARRSKVGLKWELPPPTGRAAGRYPNQAEARPLEAQHGRASDRGAVPSASAEETAQSL